MKTLFNLKSLLIVAIITLTFSCKTSGDPVASDSDAIKAGDSTSINSGSKGTTRGANEGNEGGQDVDPKSDSLVAPKK